MNSRQQVISAAGYLQPLSIISGLSQVFSELTADGRMTQAAESLSFDLTHAFACDAHLAAYFFQCVSLPI